MSVLVVDLYPSCVTKIMKIQSSQGYSEDMELVSGAWDGSEKLCWAVRKAGVAETTLQPPEGDHDCQLHTVR